MDVKDYAARILGIKTDIMTRDSLVAGIGNVLRHDYESIAAPIMWKLAHRSVGAGQILPRGIGCGEVERTGFP
jgi:hypothetical protein